MALTIHKPEVSSVSVKDEALGGTRILELGGWAEHQDSTKQQGKERGIVCGGGGKGRNLSLENKS